MIKRTDARGVKTNFVYASDPLNRLQSISYDKSNAINSGTIADAEMVTIGYEPNGDKTRVKTVKTGNPNSPTTLETNTYDNLSRIQTYTIGMFGKTPMSSLYVYDTVNRLTSVTYPDALNTPLSPKIVTPSYDNASRLTQMAVNGQTQLSEIVYNPLSQVTQLKTGAYSGNADIEQYSYDAQTGLLTNQKVIKQNTSQTLLDLSYNYQRGNSKGSLNGKTGQLTNIVNNLDSNKNRVYEFDTLGRLMTAKGGQAAGGNGVANWTQNYGYDRYGNRLSVSATGVTANNQAVPLDGLASLSYDQNSNRITNSNYEYDAAGNQTRGQAPNGTFQRFDYDAAGRLVNVKDDNGNVLESYAYGASRQRLKTSNSSLTTYYAWGGSSVLVEYSETTGNSASFKFSKSYIYAGSRLLSTQIWDGTAETTEFHHPDRLGTKLVTNNAANTHYEQSTLPFGTSLDAEFIGTPTTNQRFTSYDRSNVASLDYAVNRSYSSGQGRFTTVDPIGIASSSEGNPQSFNLYAYVENNPIDFVDPSGLDIPSHEGVHIGIGPGTTNVTVQISFNNGQILGGGMGRFSGIDMFLTEVSVDGNGFSPIPIEELLNSVKTFLEAKLPTEKCEKLLAGVLDAFNKIKDKIFYDLKYFERRTDLSLNFTHARTEDDNSQIRLNPNSIVFNREIRFFDKNAKEITKKVVDDYFKDYKTDRNTFATAIVIHELLHVVGKFGYDSINGLSIQHTKEVLNKCFKKK